METKPKQTTLPDRHGPVSSWMRNPITGKQFFTTIENFNQAIAAIWDSLGSQENKINELLPVVMVDDYVQQTITALERNLGDRVRVITDLTAKEDSLASQLGEATASELLIRGDGTKALAISLLGCEGIVVDRDQPNRTVLVRLLFTPAILMLFREEEVELVNEGRVVGVFSSLDLTLEGS